jgi:plastocyanin
MMKAYFTSYKLGLLVPLFLLFGVITPSWSARNSEVHQVNVPGEDRFAPFALVIRAGDTVQWINNDTDDHTIVSDDFFNTTENRKVDRLIPGTAKGKAGTFRLRFRKPGQFVYYCRFHAQLDAAHQPVAPGPDGGIKDGNGNFGTPMMGVITILGENDR